MVHVAENHKHSTLTRICGSSSTERVANRVYFLVWPAVMWFIIALPCRTRPISSQDVSISVLANLSRNPRIQSNFSSVHSGAVPLELEL